MPVPVSAKSDMAEAIENAGVTVIHKDAGKVIGFMLYGYFGDEDEDAWPITFDGAGTKGVNKIFTSVDTLINEYYSILYDEDWGFEEEDLAAVMVVVDYDGNIQYPSKVKFRVASKKKQAKTPEEREGDSE